MVSLGFLFFIYYPGAQKKRKKEKTAMDERWKQTKWKKKDLCDTSIGIIGTVATFKWFTAVDAFGKNKEIKLIIFPR